VQFFFHFSKNLESTIKLTLGALNVYYK